MRTFSLGALYAVPAGANPTPVPIASLKDASVDFKQTKKKFNGNQRVAIDVADGALEIGIKIKNADFRSSAFQLVMPQATSAVGGLQVATGEAGVIPTTPFQITVSQSALFVEDGGVLDLNTGKWLARVASAPTTGQYSMAAGVYTFATADTGHNVQIVYTYTVATGAQKTSLSNSIQSQSTAFKLRMYNPYSLNGTSKLVGYDFYSVHFEKLAGMFKVEDFAEHDLEGFASQDMLTNTSKVLDYWSAD